MSTSIALMMAKLSGMDTPVTPTDPGLLTLHTELFAFTDKQLDQPTAADRGLLMANRSKIKAFDRSGLSDADQKAAGSLYIASTRRANRQEDYYERNGNKFADGKEF